MLEKLSESLGTLNENVEWKHLSREESLKKSVRYKRSQEKL